MRIVPLLFIVLIGLKLALDGWQILRKRPLPGDKFLDTAAFLQNTLLAGFFTCSPIFALIPRHHR